MMRAVLSPVLLLVILLHPSSANSQVPDRLLTQVDKARLDSLAALTAKTIRAAKFSREPKVLVFDFFRNSPGTSSQLGTFLADRLSESLATYSAGMEVLDREAIRNFLTENWTTLEDFSSYEICFGIARLLGADGLILGTLSERNGSIELTLHLEGLGSKENEVDLLAWRDRTVVFPITEDLRTALLQPGPNYSRKVEEIPNEPGVFRADVPGVTSPSCIYCPQPEYSDAARAAKFQGTVQLSVVVTSEGNVTGIFVLKGAPFGLTAQAISVTKKWRLKPGQKDGKSVSVRVPIETTFHLY